MHTTLQKRIISRLLAAPACQWKTQVSKLLARYPAHELQPLISTLASVAEQTAWLSEYIQLRGQHSISHPKASKAARRLQIKVSRALGYSYPESRGYNG